MANASLCSHLISFWWLVATDMLSGVLSEVKHGPRGTDGCAWRTKLHTMERVALDGAGLLTISHSTSEVWMANGRERARWQRVRLARLGSTAQDSHGGCPAT